MLVPDALLYAARTFPENPAIVAGDRAYTYAQFAARVAKLKHALADLGVRHGDRVAILMLNDFRYLEIQFGMTALGAIFVPLNTRLSVDELAFVLNDAEAEVLFIHKEFLPVLPELRQKAKGIRRVILAEDREAADAFTAGDDLLSYEELLEAQPDVPLTVDNVQEDDIAGLYYTGGTTGRSKGVMLAHKNLVINAFQSLIFYRFAEVGDTYLHAAPMFHLADGGTTFSFTLVGGTHAFVRTFIPQDVLSVIQDQKVTACLLVPTMINVLLNTPEFDRFDLSHLRKVIYGASPMSVDLLKKAMEKLPGVQFMQAYGMTEASPVLTMLTGDDHRLDGTERQIKRLASCGRPVPCVELKVVDAAGDEVPAGVVGEFLARGPNIMKGYWKLPDETEKALHGGWYHTGDMGYRDEDNYFYVVDRAKDMIISGGENVYSVEVEQVLYQLPAILECAVIGVPDEKWGEAVKAIVVLKPGTNVTEDEIISFARTKLANYKVPKSVEFVNELPKSGAGKILKRELRERYWQGKERRVN